MRVRLSFSSVVLLSLLSVAASQIVDFQPPEIVSSNGTLAVTLDVGLVDSLAGIPWSTTGVRTATGYNGASMGPTLRVKAGDVLTVTLTNSLPPTSALDLELFAFIQDPDSDETNATKIYNRLDDIGNLNHPLFGFWGLNSFNVHFHGLQFPPSAEMLDTQVHGGESRTIVLTIPEDKEPGVNWYHDHVHGKTAHAYLSSLFGFIIVEGSTADLTAAQGVVGAREILMLLSEGLVNPDGSVPPVFPIAGQFNWTGVTNGNLGTATEYQVTQGETVLFRVASATVEPTIRMSIPNMTFTVLAYDGLPLPEPFETDVVEVTGGSRVEFLAHFDTPGTFVMTRAAWTLFPNLAACTAGGFPFFPCISYDLEQEIATITVAADANNTAPTQSLNDTVVLPGYSQRLQDLAVQESVGEKTIHFQLNRGLPLFQIPYDGPFVPPGVGFGINDRFLSPHFIEGTVIAGTCETWTIISTPPNAEHPLHVHGAQFQVTAVDGMPLADPVWRDTAPISQNMAIHVCFDRMVGGEKFLVHCHMPSHLDIGMGAFFQTVPAAASETAPPTTTPATTTETPTTSPSAGAGRKLSALAALVVGTLSTMLLSGIM